MTTTASAPPLAVPLRGTSCSISEATSTIPWAKLRRRRAVYAPTAAGISLLNGMSGLSKNNLGIFTKYVPVATTADPTNPITVNGVNIPNGPLPFASRELFELLSLRLPSTDYDLSTKTSFGPRYIYDKNSRPAITTLPSRSFMRRSRPSIR